MLYKRKCLRRMFGYMAFCIILSPLVYYGFNEHGVKHLHDVRFSAGVISLVVSVICFFYWLVLFIKCKK